MLDTQYIKDAITLSNVVMDYVKLKPSGSSKARWVGLCPFHQEKTPSFCVSDDRGFYKCFGCGASGDVLTFLQQINGVDFKEAISQCKQIAGIKDEYLSPEQRRIYEEQVKRKATEIAALRKWRKETGELLICYTNSMWRKYRNARRSGDEGDTFFSEAIAKEKALDELERMPEKELLEYYKTQRSWVGVMNPPWFLTGKRLAVAQEERKNSHVS